MRSKSSPPLQSLYITVDKRRDKESDSKVKIWRKKYDLLCDQKVAFRVLEKLVKFQDIWMVHLFQDADLR